MSNPVSVILVKGNTARILLSGGLEAKIDAIAAHRVRGKLWRAFKTGNGKHVVISVENGVTTYLHRVIACAKQEWNVYHKNGNGLDNRRCNLLVPAIGEHFKKKKKAART